MFPFQNRRNDAPEWINLGVNIIILALTVEIIRLNRINVYINSQSLTYNRDSAQSGDAMLIELKQINTKLDKEKCI